MPDIKIRVGAAADASLTNVFRSVQDSARRARESVEAEFQKAGAAVATGAKKGVDAADKEFAKLARQADKWHQQMVRDAEKAMRAETNAAEKAAAAKVKAAEKGAAAQAKAAERAAQEEVRAHKQAEREKTRATKQEAAARRKAEGEARKRASSVAATSRQGDRDLRTGLRGFGTGLSIVGRGASMGLHAGARVAGDLIQGMGVNMDASHYFSQNTDLEKQATNLSNAGYLAGDSGANGVRQDPRALMNQVRSVSSETGLDANRGMEGLRSFVGLTGDLETGRAVLKDMAVLSRATGTNLEDMISASANVSNALGDIPNKGQSIYTIMKAVAGEGKLGAVEIKDLATQMAKVAAQARLIEGDAGKNVIQLTALAQESRQRGGSASATQAATSVNSFMNTFSKGSRLKAFKANGVNVYNDQGQVRDVRSIIIESLQAAEKHGGMKNMNATMGTMFADVRARSVTRGFETLYRGGGGGAAGTRAVEAEFDRLAKAAIDDAEVMDSFRASMRTTEAQANVLNNKFQETAQGVQDVLTPALLELAPVAVQLASSLGSVITFLVGNEASMRQQVGTAGGNADTDIKNTDSQLKKGYVLDSQLKKNKEDEKALAEAETRARAEYYERKSEGSSATTKAVVRASDYVNPVNLAYRAITGRRLGAGIVDREEGRDDQRRETMLGAQSKLNDIHVENQRVANLLENKVIQVRVVNAATPPGGGPPPNNPGSRASPAPTPGD